MTTTVDDPGGLYRRAKREAEEGTALSRRDQFEADERDWRALKRAHGDATVIADELVNRLRTGEDARASTACSTSTS